MTKIKVHFGVAYSQITIENKFIGSDYIKDIWRGEDDISSMLCVGDGYLIIGTSSSLEVSLFLNILDYETDIDFLEYDHVNECSLNVVDSIIVIGGDDSGSIRDLEIYLENGMYRVFVCYKGLNTISYDGLDGDDSYHVFIWPTSERIQRRVIKQWYQV